LTIWVRGFLVGANHCINLDPTGNPRRCVEKFSFYSFYHRAKFSSTTANRSLVLKGAMRMSDLLTKLGINVPPNTTSACLTIRHSISVQEGDNTTRTLTPEGIELCHKVRPFYSLLTSELSERIGCKGTVYLCSEYPRSEATLWELFHPFQLVRLLLLSYDASLNSIKNGAWAAAREGMSDVELLQELLKERPQDLPEQFWQDALNVGYVVQATTGQTLRVVVGHEFSLSMYAAHFLPREVLGLEVCQAYLYLMDDPDILRTYKIVPE